MSPRSASSISDGEVLSGDEEKAISTKYTQARDSKVNRSARLDRGTSSRTSRLDGLMKDPTFHFRDRSPVKSRSRSRSPYRKEKSRTRSRSPYRAPKAGGVEKRRHDDDHYSSRGGSDPRRFKVRYENGQPTRSDGFQAGQSHHDSKDKPAAQPRMAQESQPSRTQTSQRDRARHGKRDRSRSPFRHNKTDSRTWDRNLESRGESYSITQAETSTSGRERERGGQRENRALASGGDEGHKDWAPYGSGTINETLAQRSKGSTREGAHDRAQDDGDSTQAAAEEPSLSEADIIEQRRKRREAIKAKHKTAPLLVQALESNIVSAPATPAHDSSAPPSEQTSPPSSIDSPSTPQRESPQSPGSPATFNITNDEELANRSHPNDAGVEDEGPSAADYDPNMDMEEDRPDHKRHDAHDAANGIQPPQPQVDAQPEVKPTKEFDMFADDDDDDDMFAPEDASRKLTTTTQQGRTLDQSLLDNWDYPDGHYRIILGELLDGRYTIQQQIGKGTFATVVRAQDTKNGTSVAVKIACNNDTMYKAGTKEMEMLQLLNQQDPDDKKHIIRLLRRFDHKGHMCLVFENLSADLREVLKKFGRNVGLNLKAIKAYAQQMFLGLSHLKKCQILHADLKPDNILVSEKRSTLKICDLGTATFANDAEVTPYLVSRFYRAPEVILGMPFDYAIDMWSIGCTLFELYTGRILFAGADNNQMLRVIQDSRGRIPNRCLKVASMIDKHFDFDTATFVSQERDKLSGKVVARPMHFKKTTPGKDLRARLSINAQGMTPAELQELNSFVDLLDKCLQLDPAKRITPNDALRHLFIVGAAKPAQVEKTNKITPAMSIPRAR